MGLTLRRTAFSLLLAAALVAVSSAAIYVTSAPRLISLLVEPFSLLLFPGLFIAMAAAAPRDFTSQSVVLWSMLIYTPLFFLALRALGRSQRHTR